MREGAFLVNLPEIMHNNGSRKKLEGTQSDNSALFLRHHAQIKVAMSR